MCTPGSSTPLRPASRPAFAWTGFAAQVRGRVSYLTAIVLLRRCRHRSAHTAQTAEAPGSYLSLGAAVGGTVLLTWVAVGIWDAYSSA
jgi:hypothetical protein